MEGPKVEIEADPELKETWEGVRDEVRLDGNIFEGKRFYLRRKPKLVDYRLLKSLIAFYGGTIRSSLSKEIDFVVDVGLNKKQLAVVRSFLKKNKRSKLLSKEEVAEKINEYHQKDGPVL